MTNGSDAAFSRSGFYADDDAYDAGLTKREYFAAMAMQGMLSNPSVEQNCEADAEAIANNAVLHAYHLITALNEDALVDEEQLGACECHGCLKFGDEAHGLTWQMDEFLAEQYRKYPALHPQTDTKAANEEVTETTK